MSTGGWFEWFAAVSAEKHRRYRTIVAVIALALLAGACSGDDESSSDDDGPDDPDEAEEQVEDEFADGPAPARWDSAVAYRVDEVSLDGSMLEITLTVATRAEQVLDDEDIRLLTNSGVELPRADEQRRTIPRRSVATMTVKTDAVTGPLRTVELRAFDMETTVDVPADGERLRWRPAPERQVGFTDGLMRDNSPVAIVPYTFRTEGMVSELTFLAVTQGSSNAYFCECRLEDSSGNAYYWMGSQYEFADPQGSRVRGTLRFFGEVPPDETEFRLFVEGSSGFVTVPNPDLEFGFSLPKAEDTELSVAASHTRPAPFDVGSAIQNEAGLQIELGELSFHDDRIQLDVRATATGDRSWDLDYSGDTVLRDSSGYAHDLAAPAGGGDLAVGAGDTVEAALVFLTPLDASADQLHLEMAVARDEVVRHTIALPERPTSDEEEGE